MTLIKGNKWQIAQGTRERGYQSLGEVFMTFIWEKNEKTSWRKWLSGFVLKKEQVLVLVFGIDNGKAA